MFDSSPAQSHLLEYLAQQAIAGRHDIGQPEIASEAMGRRDDFDPSTDSAVRVQISRLRKNLWRYYATQRSADDLCLYIPVGRYELILAPRARAYPDIAGDGREPGQSAAPEAYGLPASPERDVPTPPTTQPDTVAPSPSPAPAAALPEARRDKFPWRGLLLGALLVAIVFAIFRFFADGSPAPVRAEAPTLVLQLADSGQLDGEAAQLYAQLVTIAERQIDTSLVTDTAQGEATADYAVRISVEQLATGPTLLMRAIDREGDVIVRAEYPLDGEPPLITSEFISDILFLTSPTGIIARREVDGFNERPESAYECFLAIENLRADGASVMELLNDCRARFPDSRYEPYWLARLAYAGYQSAIRNGAPVDKSGQKWIYLQQALELDPLNPFATLVTAKVEFANGNCAAALRQTSRALNYGQTYPALIAAATADLNNCPSSGGNRDAIAAEFERLTRNAESIDPMFGLYVIISAISLDRPDIAWQVADMVETDGSGDIARGAELLVRSVREPGFFAANRSRVSNVVSQFVWGEPARQATLEWLDRNGGRVPQPDDEGPG